MSDEKKILVALSTLHRALDADAETGFKHFGPLERSELVMAVQIAEATD